MDHILKILDDFAETLWEAIKTMIRGKLKDLVEEWESGNKFR